MVFKEISYADSIRSIVVVIKIGIKKDMQKTI